MTTVVVSGAFDDLKSRHVRLLEEASRLGEVHVLLWSDEVVAASGNGPPRFSEAERRYVVDSLRYVRRVSVATKVIDPETLPLVEDFQPDAWVVDAESDTPLKRSYARSRGIDYHVLASEDLAGFPVLGGDQENTGRKKVIVTGCFDWLHSGHVRFFEEVSELGDLYVVVGHDENVRLLKGPQHPLFPQDERRYMVQAIRSVTQALISTGQGWMDAAPEIERLKPDIYAVNEDGDKPEKRAFCEQHGLEYVVLKRTPKAGLPRRQSTDLRGF